ncbi:unnamed protein product [Fusarium equiseti]|uniref:LysM domain-containing protein n=1 Tax=Fusarium equiseti TaxID=61235 RepID=A0A8J2NHS2_FUSEQ|nr:unnamed protein product [Fusarium equiseti]
MFFHVFILLSAGTQISIAQDVIEGDTLGRWGREGTFPIAYGSRLDCQHYWWIDNATNPVLANCYMLSSIYGTEFEDFILWNPSLADTSTAEAYNGTDEASVTASLIRYHEFKYTCTMALSLSYCMALPSPATCEATTAKTEIATPTPRAGGEIANCTMWFDHYYEASCEDLMLTYDLYFDEFYEMNPSVKADCSGLVLGMNYCRSTYPGGREVGIPGWHSDDEDDVEIDSETYQQL